MTHQNIPRLLSLVLVVALPALAQGIQATPPHPTIRLDGVFTDWDGLASLQIRSDDTAVQDPAQPVLQQLWSTCDADFLYLRLQFDTERNLQGLNQLKLELAFDADGNPQTGRAWGRLPGADLILTFSPPHPHAPDDAPGAGVAAQLLPDSPLVQFDVYLLDTAFAPTYAAREIEMRVRRHQPLLSHPALFCGDETRAAIRVFENGRLLDETTPVTLALAPARFPLPKQEPRAGLPVKPESTWRVVSWNSRYAGFIKNPAPFARVLRCLDPDVILFQELTQQVAAEELAAWLNSHLDDSNELPWRAGLHRVPNRQAPAVASRFPMDFDLRTPPLAELKPTPGFSAARVEIQGRSVLFGSIHLPCCGFLDSPRDRTRVAEAEQIAAWLQTLLASAPPAGIVLGGDLNLVGGIRPLQILTSSNDLDGTDLEVSHPLHLDQAWDSTWADPAQPYTPGRLDYVMHSDATLDCVQSFIFDPAVLDPQTLASTGLQPGDVVVASDHFPLVLDFRFAHTGDAPTKPSATRIGPRAFMPQARPPIGLRNEPDSANFTCLNRFPSTLSTTKDPA